MERKEPEDFDGVLMPNDNYMFWWDIILCVHLKVPVTDPTQLEQHLFLQHEKFERLSFPDGVDETFGVEQSVS